MIYKSPIGEYTMASDGKSLLGLWLHGQKYFGMPLLTTAVNYSDLQIFKDTQNWLDKYFAGKNPQISELPLAPIGNDFRQRIWQLLCEIPYGKICTYADIAKIVAKERRIPKMSAQAIGGAVGHNPISIIIPCHRVVSSNGSLTGYAGGIETKIKLLKHEGANVGSLFIPKNKTAQE